MFNISFMTCIKRYIGHKSLEDQTLSGRNRCLAPSHFVIQPLDLSLWLSKSSLVFTFYFGQNVTRTKNHVIIQQIVTRTQNYVIFNFPIMYIFIQSTKRTIQSCILYLVFFYFFNKKISGDSIPLIQKERCPKKHSKNLFFLRGTQILTVSHTSPCCDCTITILGILLQ